MGRIAREKRLLMEEANKVLLGEAYEGIIKQGDTSCDIKCKRKIAKNGSSGDVVKMIQHLLSHGGYNNKYLGGGMEGGCGSEWGKCDGKYRKHTKDAVQEFQIKYKLKPDGVVGYDTLTKMCEVLKVANTADNSMQELCKKCNCDDKEKQNDGNSQIGGTRPYNPKYGDKNGNWWEMITQPLEQLWDRIIGGNPEANCAKVNECLKSAMGSKRNQWESFLGCIGPKIDSPITNPNPKKDCEGCPKYVWGGAQVAGGGDAYWKRKELEGECLKNQCSIFTRDEKLMKDNPELFK